MKTFLEKIGLVKTFTSEIKVSKEEFVKQFKRHITTENNNLFSKPPNNEEYKGYIDINDFNIVRRKKTFLLDIAGKLILAKASFIQKEQTLEINTTLNGFQGRILKYSIINLLIYLFVIIKAFDDDSLLEFLTLNFIFIHLYIIQYILIKKSINTFKLELEKKYNSTKETSQ